MAAGREGHTGEQETVVELRALIDQLQKVVTPEAKRIQQLQYEAREHAKRQARIDGRHDYVYPAPQFNLISVMNQALQRASDKLKEQDLLQDRNALVSETLPGFFNPLYALLILNKDLKGKVRGVVGSGGISALVLASEADSQAVGRIRDFDVDNSSLYTLLKEEKYGLPPRDFFEKLHEILSKALAEDFTDNPPLTCFVGLLNASFGFTAVTDAQKKELTELADWQAMCKQAAELRAQDEAMKQRQIAMAAEAQRRAEAVAEKKRQTEADISKKTENINQKITALEQIGTAKKQKSEDARRKQLEDAAGALYVALQAGVTLPQGTAAALEKRVEQAITQAEKRLDAQFKAEKIAAQQAKQAAPTPTVTTSSAAAAQVASAAATAAQPAQAAHQAPKIRAYLDWDGTMTLMEGGKAVQKALYKKLFENANDPQWAYRKSALKTEAEMVRILQEAREGGEDCADYRDIAITRDAATFLRRLMAQGGVPVIVTRNRKEIVRALLQVSAFFTDDEKIKLKDIEVVGVDRLLELKGKRQAVEADLRALPDTVKPSFVFVADDNADDKTNMSNGVQAVLPKVSMMAYDPSPTDPSERSLVEVSGEISDIRANAVEGDYLTWQYLADKLKLPEVAVVMAAAATPAAAKPVPTTAAASSAAAANAATMQPADTAESSAPPRQRKGVVINEKANTEHKYYYNTPPTTVAGDGGAGTAAAGLAGGATGFASAGQGEQPKASQQAAEAIHPNADAQQERGREQAKAEREQRIQTWLAEPTHRSDAQAWGQVRAQLSQLTTEYLTHLDEYKSSRDHDKWENKKRVLLLLEDDLKSLKNAPAGILQDEIDRRCVAQFMVRLEENKLGKSSLKERRHRFSILSYIAGAFDRLLAVIGVPAKKRPTAVYGVGFFEEVESTVGDKPKHAAPKPKR